MSAFDPKRKSSGIICCDAHEPTFDVLGCHPWVSGRLMRRRVFITLLGGATAWPFAARGQQSNKVFKIGFIATGGVPLYTNAFHDALQNLGWIEGKNVVYESRYAENRLDRLPELAAELLRLNIDVIVAGGTTAALAAKRATATVPIVMAGRPPPLGGGALLRAARPARDREGGKRLRGATRGAQRVGWRGGWPY